MSRCVALVGGGGQLARDLIAHWAAERPSERLVPLDHAAVEVSDEDSVRSVMEQTRPDVVINTAAYHKVDQVEDDPDRAFAVNAIGVRNLARACQAMDAVLVHLSTDYVFSGPHPRPYEESDPPNPVNVYGVSKVAGEMMLRHLWRRHFIVRTCGLYGVAGSSGKGGNFVELMLRLAREGQPIRVVADQVLSPTGTHVLAPQIAALVDSERYGLYHATDVLRARQPPAG